MAKAYVQPITRKQALSYERLIPNGIGVTTLAAVNGRGAAARAERAMRNGGAGYEERYEATKNVLRGYSPSARPAPMAAAKKNAAKGSTDMEMVANRRKKPKAKKGGTRKRRSAAQRAATAALVKLNKARAKKSRKSSGKARKAAAKPARKSARRRKSPAYRTEAWKTIAAGKKRVRLLKARVGGTTFRTYLVAGKRGKVHKAPDWMLQGASSAKEYATIHAKAQAGDEKALKKYNAMKKRAERFLKMRERKAKQVELHGDMFTPNAMTYAEWEKTMTPNKRKKGKKAAKKSARRGKAKRSAAQRAATRALIAYNKSRKGKKGKARKAHKGRKHSPKTARRSVSRRRAAHKRKDILVMRFQANKKRHYHRNPTGHSIKDILMSGLAVTAGFASHRAIRHALDVFAFSKIPGLKDGEKAATYRTMISSAATVLVGVGVLQLLKGKAVKSEDAKSRISEAQGGMVASVVLDLITQALGVSKNETAAKVVPYLSGFGEYVPMSGFGEYVPMSGLGSYYPMSGLGAITQAAAGVPLSGGMTQAAAGMGAITQAAAGMGAITQAAAGMGEFFPTRPKHLLTQNLPIAGFGRMDDGIMPNLSAAERALTVAEAVAGLGEDTSEKSIVDAWQADLDISDPDSAASRNYGSLSPFVDEGIQDPEDIDDEAKGLRTGVLAGGSFF